MSERKDAGLVASRRDVLKLVAAGAPAAATFAIAGGAEAAEPPTSLGLRKTEHVRKYLESARF